MSDFNAVTASYKDLKDYAKIYDIRIMGVKKEELRKNIMEHMATNNQVEELSLSQPLIKSAGIPSDKPQEGKVIGKRVKIIVHESADPNAINPVFIGVNGRGYTINRGVEDEVPSNVVDVLNNARETIYDRKRDDFGKEFLVAREALSYPFSIL